jgi:hypothetical protein
MLHVNKNCFLNKCFPLNFSGLYASCPCKANLISRWLNSVNGAATRCMISVYSNCVYLGSCNSKEI